LTSSQPDRQPGSIDPQAKQASPEADLEALVEARSAAGAPLARPGAHGRLPILLAVMLLVVGGGAIWAVYQFVFNKDVPMDRGTTTPASEPAEISRPPVLAVTEPAASQPASAASAPEVVVAVPDRPIEPWKPEAPLFEVVLPPSAPARPAPRPAVSPDDLLPSQLARLRAKVLVDYAGALEAYEAGDTVKAQELLVKMLNGYDRRVWPADAAQTLMTIQQKIRVTVEPAPADLAEQRRRTADLFAKAQRLESQGDLRGAQEALLELLNTYHRQAWPKGAGEMLEQVKKRIVGASSKPSFLGLEAPATR